MAFTINGINKKLKFLQNEIAYINKQHETDIKELHKKYSTAITALMQEKDRAIKQAQRESDAKSRAIVQEAISNLKAQTDALIEAQKREIDEYKRKSDALLLKMAEINEENERKIADFLNSEKSSDNAKMEVAKEYILSAENVENEMIALPLDAFSFRNEFNAVQQSLENAKKQLMKKNYEASMSIASNAKTGMLSLYFRFHRSLNEWSEYFNEWSVLVNNAYSSLESAMCTPIKTAYTNSELSKTEWNFWTEGQFSSIYNELSENMKLIENIREMSTISYLKKTNSIKQRDLRDMYDKAKSYNEKVDSVKNKCVYELVLSDEREYISEKIINTMKNFNYELIDIDEMGYASPEYIVAKNDWYKEFIDFNFGDLKPIGDYMNETQNPLQYYEFHMTYPGKDKLIIRIVPERLDGVAVRNVCMLEMELSGAPDRSVYLDLIETNYNRINSCLSSLSELNHTQLDAKPSTIMPERIEKNTEKYQKGKERTKNIIF